MSVIILTLCFVSLGVGLLSYWCRTKGDRTFSSVETNPMQVLRVHPGPNNAPKHLHPLHFLKVDAEMTASERKKNRREEAAEEEENFVLVTRGGKKIHADPGDRDSLV
jgi:hypothetical protein